MTDDDSVGNDYIRKQYLVGDVLVYIFSGCNRLICVLVSSTCIDLTL